ncbi:MAG: ATP-binding cassette domain-containing protein [Oscillospiraceae bacterium]|nr:ATP-binding cassette domain-containing protein [Oscillospiraceae bacterium]
MRVVRAFGREKYELDKFRAKNDHFRDSWIKLADLMSFFWNFGDLFSALQVMAVVLCGTVFCVRGELTPGNLIAFISYNSMLIWPVRHLGRTISEMSKASVSINRIRYILLMEPEKDPESPEMPDMRADIVFDHVGFSYADGVKTLNDVSFSIGSGQTVGILGSTGSGKSTLNTCSRVCMTPTKAASQSAVCHWKTSHGSMCAATSALCCRSPICSRGRWEKISASPVRICRRRPLPKRSQPQASTKRYKSSRTDWIPSSASAA